MFFMGIMPNGNAVDGIVFNDCSGIRCCLIAMEDNTIVRKGIPRDC